MEDLKTLGRYQIKGVLGKGAMGLVYDGLDPGLDRRVAIKTILTSKLQGDAAKMITMRFEREVRAVARLNHGNIVQVYDFGSEGDLAYIVMEYVKGKELQEFLDAKERLDLRSIFRLTIELLDALECAHEAGIIHRDVKPANIMVDANGHAKLADFGVARVTNPDGGPQGEATRVGTVVGTPSYMSPEQVQGLPLDRRSDVFSAGIIFYQLLTGKKPFAAENQFALQAQIVQLDPVWPSQIVQVPPEYDRAVAKALAKEPDQRYASARKFAEALKRVMEGKPPEEPGESVVQLKGSGSAAPARSDKPTEAETEFWNEVKGSDDPDEVSLYLDQYPSGAYAEIARKRIAELSGK